MLLFYFACRYREKPHKPLRYDIRACGLGAGTKKPGFLITLDPSYKKFRSYSSPSIYLGDQIMKSELGEACCKRG